MTALVVIAKQPVAGRVKTRLHPPLTLEQAARLAAAAIDDTIAATASLPASRRILLYDGDEVPASARGFELLPQAAGTLDERLAAAFDTLDEPMVLIGMDTPQLQAADLVDAFDDGNDAPDAWLGPAADGGFWALSLRNPRGGLVRGVPMSRADTGLIQRQRLEGAGLRVRDLATLVDVDTIDDAREVAARAPHLAFARLLSEFAGASVVGRG